MTPGILGRAAASYNGSQSEETRDGVRYVRLGDQSSVHVAAFAHYGRRPAFDIVVDQINTIPFMTPLYMKLPRVAFIHQLAREVWIHEKGRILGTFGMFVEPHYLRPYRKTPIITVSPSSAASLRQTGFKGPIFTIPLCVDEIPDADVPRKTPEQDILVLGRLTPSKRIEESIKASVLLRQAGWAGSLLIAGGGASKYGDALQRLAAQLKAPVKFLGPVSSTARRSLLQNCSVLWMTSAREGWGLVVTEAACHGTPAVVYDVPGLRDSVIDGVTGYVTPATPDALAERTRQLLNHAWLQFAAAALESVRDRSWEDTTSAFESALKRVIQNHASRSRVKAVENLPLP